MGKRRNGEGSWGKKKIGQYMYHYYRDVNGKYTYGKTVKEVNQKLEKKKSQQFILDEKTTFGEYITEWLNKTKKKSIEPTTFDCYELMIKSQILNFKEYNIANKQLSNLNSDVFQKYIDALATKYSRATIKKVWSIIKQCVSYGEIKEEIPYNTTKLVNIPSESNVEVKKKEVPFLNKNDVEKLYKILNKKHQNGTNIFGSNAHALILIMYSGMRVSEMIALKWKNVDFDNKKIKIESSSTEIINRNNDGGKRYIKYEKTTKTESGNRTIPLPDRAMEMLKWFDRKNPKHKPEDYVCVTKNNTQIMRRNVNKTLKLMAELADTDIKNFTVHTLRHTYGSILISEGVDIKKVSELLGHSDITVTYNIYIGIYENDKKSEIERVFNTES